MKEDSNKIVIYIKILIIIIGIFFFMTFMPKDDSWEKLGYVYNPMTTETKDNAKITADPIKLQFKTGFEYGYDNIDKKNNFLENKIKNRKDSDERENK
jgi:hypothetical protein